jgi:Bacterial SH3 domain
MWCPYALRGSSDTLADTRGVCSGRANAHGGETREFNVCRGGWLRWFQLVGGRCRLLPLLSLALVACGKDSGETGVKVIVTPPASTPTNIPRSLTPVGSPLPLQTPVAFPPTSPTITNALSSQLAAGAKARVKDSADGLTLRESPSTKAKAIETLAAGTVLSILSDPQDAEGRTWVKVSHGSNQGYVATEFIERVS